MNKVSMILITLLTIVVTIALFPAMSNQIDRLNVEGYYIPEREIEMEYNIPALATNDYKWHDSTYTTSDTVVLAEEIGGAGDAQQIFNNSTDFIDLYPLTLDIDNYPNTYQLKILVQSIYNYTYKASDYSSILYYITFADESYNYVSRVTKSYTSSQLATVGNANNFTMTIDIPATAEYFVIDEYQVCNDAIPNKTTENLNVSDLTIIGESLDDALLVEKPILGGLVNLLPILIIVAIIAGSTYYILRRN